MASTILMIHGMCGGPRYRENCRRVFEAEACRCVAAEPGWQAVAECSGGWRRANGRKR